MGRKILIVDDEPNIVRFVQINLERQGYDVITATDGWECLEKVRSEKPDLLLLDIKMPIVDGIGVLKELRETPDTANLPVIIMSKEDEDRDTLASDDDRVERYLPKPFDLKELLAMVKTILGD